MKDGRIRRKSGPRTVYDRSETETIRVSPLFKQLIAENAKRCNKSVGDFVEHLGRTRAASVTPEEFPDDRRASASA